MNHARLVASGTSKDGVPSRAACIALKNHPHDRKGKLVVLWGDECMGSVSVWGGLCLGAL